MMLEAKSFHGEEKTVKTVEAFVSPFGTGLKPGVNEMLRLSFLHKAKWPHIVLPAKTGVAKARKRDAAKAGNLTRSPPATARWY
jgi:hypothetical protein